MITDSHRNCRCTSALLFPRTVLETEYCDRICDFTRVEATRKTSIATTYNCDFQSANAGVWVEPSNCLNYFEEFGHSDNFCANEVQESGTKEFLVDSAASEYHSYWHAYPEIAV